MLAYEKGRHQAGPTPWRSDASLSSSSCWFLYCRFRMLQKSQVSASVLSYVFAIMSIFFASVCDVNSFLLFDFLGRSDCCGPVFSLSMQSSTPHSYAFSLISLLFPPVFFEERESWREGFLDLLTKAKCKEQA